MTKYQLPIIENPVLLPTGKQHISFSEMTDWIDCSYRHKLKHIDKVNLDKPSIHTEFGSTIHDALEEYLLNRKPFTSEMFNEINKTFRLKMEVLNTNHPGSASEKDINDFAKSIEPILLAVPDWLEEQFPGWEPIAAEWNLYEKVEKQKSKFFKGYIDCIIRVPKKKKIRTSNKQTPMRLSELRGVEAETEYDIYIVDWKTTSWGWDANKKRDFNKQMQLVLYKHFWCKYFGFDLKQVKTGFVLLKRTPKAKTGERCEFVPVSVGPKTEERALSTMQNMLNQLQQKRFIKNRSSCQYCVYSGTEHCT
jgi:hypothetical protein